MNGWTPGIDVSHHQGRVDWPAVAESGQLFAIAKATEGKTHVDRLFAAHWPAMRDAGLVRGAYHFFRWQSSSPEDQAEHFAQIIADAGGLDPGDLPPAVDLEWADHKGVAIPDRVARALAMLDACEELFGVVPMVYAGPNFWKGELGGTASLARFPLWVVKYKTTPPPPMPPWASAGWRIWQYTGKGQVDGITRKVDRNWFAGDEAALRAFASAPEVAPTKCACVSQ